MPEKKTLKQMLKFILVSLLASAIQLVSVNVLFFLLRGWTPPLPGFLASVFSEQSVGAGNSNWGYVLLKEKKG